MSLVRNLDAKDSKKDISNRVRKNLIFIISGPSGVGKTTLIKRLLSLPDLKTTLVKSVSFTTRTPRKDERDKKDYYFLTKEEFILKKRKGELLEWTEYLGHFYGTDRTFIDNLLEKGKDVLLCLDTKGAFKVRKIYPKNSVLVFILPSSLRVLEEKGKRGDQFS
jgi:guanylate kinase